MSKIPGLGELLEGVLEKDPLDDTYQIRFTDDDDQQRVVRLQEVLDEYVGHDVRFTIAFTRALAAAAERIGDEGATAAVTFDGVTKGN